MLKVAKSKFYIIPSKQICCSNVNFRRTKSYKSDSIILFLFELVLWKCALTCRDIQNIKSRDKRVTSLISLFYILIILLYECFKPHETEH